MSSSAPRIPNSAVSGTCPTRASSSARVVPGNRSSERSFDCTSRASKPVTFVSSLRSDSTIPDGERSSPAKSLVRRAVVFSMPGWSVVTVAAATCIFGSATNTGFDGVVLGSEGTVSNADSMVKPPFSTSRVSANENRSTRTSGIAMRTSFSPRIPREQRQKAEMHLEPLGDEHRLARVMDELDARHAKRRGREHLDALDAKIGNEDLTDERIGQSGDEPSPGRRAEVQHEADGTRHDEHEHECE